jgi:PKD repeat protein
MKKFYIVLIGLLFGLSVGFEAFGQTTVFYQEDFSALTEDGFGNTWDYSQNWGQTKNSIDLSNGELFIDGSSAFYCAPLISSIDVTAHDRVEISFRYKAPQPTTNRDQLEVILGEDYAGWNNFGSYSETLLTSGADDSYKYVSFEVDQAAWSTYSSMQLCFKFNDSGGAGVYIDDIEIKGITASAAPIVDINASSQMIFEEDVVQLFDSSTDAPTSWEWGIIPGGEGTYYEFVDGTTANSQNPKVKFLVEGIYDIRLTANNAYGSSTKTFSQFITVSCPAFSDNINMGHITNTFISSKEYASTNSVYTSFVDDPASLPLGSDFTIEVRASDDLSDTYWWDSSSNGTSRNVVVWFDWDKNGFFDETPENVSVSRIKIKSTYYYIGLNTISIPTTVTPGRVNVRIKLANKVEDVASACGNVSVGEVEDYAINFYSGSVSSLLGNAFEFKGGYAETQSPVLETGTSFTIEGWFNLAQVAGNHGFIGQQGAYALGLKNGFLVFETGNGSSISGSWNYTGQWMHIAVSADAGNLTMYVNGNPISSVAGSTAYWSGTSNNDLRFAKGIFTDDFITDPAFVGQMDEIRIWDVARDSASIATGIFSTVNSGTANLIAYYQFNDVQVSESLKDWQGNFHAIHYDYFADDYVLSGVPFIWTGALGSISYNFAGNWSWGTGEMPFSANKAIIPQDSIVELPSYSTYRVGSLDLRPGANFTIAENASLTVTDSIILKSTIENVASLLDAGELVYPEGHTSIELPLIADQWYRLGQPFASPTGDMYKAGDPTSWVYRSTTNWQRITDAANAIAPMEGIMVLYDNDVTLNSTGSLNTGAISWTITYGRGYYLFSNPYPSAIDWTPRWPGETNDTGVAVSDNVDQTIYYRVYAGAIVGDYNITYNAATDISSLDLGGTAPGGYTRENVGKISPLQSVWVKINDGNPATIELDNRARTMEDSPSLKSASSDNHQNIIRIMQANEYISDVAVLYFSDRYVESIDREDSEKMFNSSQKVPEVYTRADEKSLAINGLPVLLEQSYAIPVSVRNRVDGDVKFSVKLDEFTNNFEVVLEDRVTSEWINMNDVNEYVYTPAQLGDVHDRFVLHLNPVLQVPTDVVDIDNGNSGDIQIENRETYALVTISRDLLNGNAATIDLMDINGRQISSTQTSSDETEIQLPDATGVYLIKVTAGTQQKTAKIMRY